MAATTGPELLPAPVGSLRAISIAASGLAVVVTSMVVGGIGTVDVVVSGAAVEVAASTRASTVGAGIDGEAVRSRVVVVASPERTRLVVGVTGRAVVGTAAAGGLLDGGRVAGGLDVGGLVVGGLVVCGAAVVVGAAIVWEMVRLEPSARNVTDHVPGDRVMEPDVRPAELVAGKSAERVPPGPLAMTATGSPATGWPSSQLRVTL